MTRLRNSNSYISCKMGGNHGKGISRMESFANDDLRLRFGNLVGFVGKRIRIRSCGLSVQVAVLKV